MKRLLLLLVLIVLVPLTKAEVKYTTPTCPGMSVFILNGINNNGVMVGGYYTDADPLSHPLMISKQGKCTALAQNTILAQKFGFGAAVNERGDIAGVYYDDGYFAGAAHGFFIDKKGAMTLIDFPTADGSAAYGINESGTVAGAWYVNDSSGNLLFQHGFEWKDGNFTDVVYPAYSRTELGGINAQGDSVGTGIDFIGHPFIYSHGEITPIDLPPSAIGSSPQGINGKGEIVGQFFDDVFTLHGFLKTGSDYRIFDFPGANWTSVQGINNAGQMVGAYWDSNWTIRGFVAEIQK